jgi:hypothetical protein
MGGFLQVLCEIVDEHPYLSVVGSLEQDELSLF